MSEQVRLMVSPIRTVVGSDVLPRRLDMTLMDKAHFVKVVLLCAGLRPQSDRGETHVDSLFTQTRDHSQIEKSGRCSAFSVAKRHGKCLTNCVLPLSIGVD